jgi:MoxR-like ATPase
MNGVRRIGFRRCGGHLFSINLSHFRMNNSPDIGAVSARVAASSQWVAPLGEEIGKVLIGQKYMVSRLLVGLLTGGHVLLEGVPGLAKTLAVRTLAGALSAKFSRIQFTPDLLPADVVGTLIYNPRDGVFTTRRGPIFANIVLADEVNRAPAKVQSALLEAMQERQVTLGDQTHLLPSPFLVLATENPIDQEGTYPLPEAQVDRFMLKLKVGYPSLAEERAILDRMARTAALDPVTPVVTLPQIMEARAVVDEIFLSDAVRDYIVKVVTATREPEKAGAARFKGLIRNGASPRATIALALAAKAWAYLEGRAFVVPDDVKTIGADVLRHRVLLSYEAEAEEVTAEAVVQGIFNAIPVP